MDNVIPLTGDDVTPAMVMHTLAKRLEDINEIIVVTLNIDPNQAPFSVYASGNLTALPHAALILQDFALKYVRGEVAHKDPHGA